MTQYYHLIKNSYFCFHKKIICINKREQKNITLIHYVLAKLFSLLVYLKFQADSDCRYQFLQKKILNNPHNLSVLFHFLFYEIVP